MKSSKNNEITPIISPPNSFYNASKEKKLKQRSYSICNNKKTTPSIC